ncbi:MAG TPA: tetratricopeptide repeat protein, partial [Blastocatellia bacterium]|nr:tetratricopeptide repeat protein [Blastocatellia bacterium]
FPRAHYELGRALLRAGQYMEAMSELQKAIEQQEGVLPEAHFQMGILNARRGDIASALDCYHTAIKQSGGVYPEAYYHLGLAHVSNRDQEAAMRAFRAAIEQRGGYYPEAHNDLGRVLYSTGNLQAANDAYSTAVRQRNRRGTAPLATPDRAADSGQIAFEKARRSEQVAEELGNGLRQAPATTDSLGAAEQGGKGAGETAVRGTAPLHSSSDS